MLATSPNLADLSDADRQWLESWLVRFDQSWHENRLAEQARELPPEGTPWRRTALIELIKIDLERQWQRGMQPTVESYLAAYPELGGPDGVPVDLLQAEYEVRQQFGATLSWSEFGLRFPQLVDELRRRVEQKQGSATDSGRSQSSFGTVQPSFATPSEVQPSGAASSLPEQFGRYRIIKQLGKGGMGAVYLVHDCQLDRQVALKVPKFTSEDPELLQRFYREARAAAALSHPNLCPVHDVGEINGVHFLTMAYIRGQSLAEHVRARQFLAQDQAAGIVRKVALALARAHQHGVIHRDLKPANIMLDPNGEPIVMDFGLARRLDQGDSRLTKSGAILGTPAYMSPEQVDGATDRIGATSDVYSLGVILYELLTGKLPFEGSAVTIMFKITSEAPPAPSIHRPDLDRGLEAICLKAMARKPEDRYATMDDLAAALVAWESTGVQPLSAPVAVPLAAAGRSGGATSRRWWLAGGAVAALVVLGTTVVVATVIVIRTRSGDIKIETTDRNPTILVDGKQVSGLTEKEPAQGGSKEAGPSKAAKTPSTEGSPATASISDATPSADPKKPASLKPGEVVKGRVDPRSKTNQAHYWLLDLPAGEYKAVVDMERADRGHSNIQGTLQLLGADGSELRKLGNLNEIDYRARGVFRFRIDKPHPVVVRVTTDQMMDYHLTLVPATASVPTPYFRKTPKVTALKLGETFTPPALDGSKAETYDAFCSMTLPAGDYKVTFGFRRLDGKRSNIHGSLEAFTMDGKLTKKLGNVNEIDTSAASTVKLALSEEQSLIFRLSSDQKVEATFKVDRVKED